MKIQLRLALSGFAFLLASALSAQSNNFLHVKIPFEFVVSGQKMPAGDYTIEESGTSGAMTFKNQEARQSAIVLGEPETVSAELAPGLKFEKHNGEEHLVRVVSGIGLARLLAVR